MSNTVPEIRTIRGREYRYYRPGFDAWTRLSAELAQVSGPLVSVLTGLSKEDGRGASVAIIDLARGLLSGIQGGLLDRLCGSLSWNDMREGRDEWRALKTTGARDAIWTGSYEEGVLVLAWILGVTYAGFTTTGGDLVSELSSLLGVGGLLSVETMEAETPR